MARITVLDGAIGQELVARSGDRATPLWSTQVMIDHPDLVGAVHDAYFQAGATVATTNTYAVHLSRLERVGLGAQLPQLLDTALGQAEAARDRAGHGRIAGAIGPLLASYRPDLNPDPDDAAPKFAAIARQMAPRVDLLLIETVSSLTEAEGALRGCMGHGVPVWIAFTVQDDDGTRLRSGEALADIAPLIVRHNPDALLINCARPEAFPAALAILRPLGKPFGGYANGFTHIADGFLVDAPTVDALDQRRDLTPDRYADHVMHWIDLGATIVGGCCEIGPDHIATLAHRLRMTGHEIT
ncbi:MAG: homocysteine S-methyltransferase family protein [Marinibacterium sp.]|nr:homocysteine S-methyltransferase family protein [Marinibacterium sp.]